MKKAMAAVITLGLILGITATAKAGYDVRHGQDVSYGSYYDVDFSKWVGSERDRIRNAYRAGQISEDQYQRLSDRLGSTEAFHERAFSRGWITSEEQRRLKSMQARVSADISREIPEPTG